MGALTQYNMLNNITQTVWLCFSPWGVVGFNNKGKQKEKQNEETNESCRPDGLCRGDA